MSDAEAYTLDDVDPEHPVLSAREARMFEALLSKRAYYIEHGRGVLAHGVGIAIALAWAAIVGGVDLDVTVPGDL